MESPTEFTSIPASALENGEDNSSVSDWLVPGTLHCQVGQSTIDLFKPHFDRLYKPLL